jgi:hypothetical protein
MYQYTDTIISHYPLVYISIVHPTLPYVGVVSVSQNLYAWPIRKVGTGEIVAKIKSYCRSCNKSTNHEVCAQESKDTDEEYHQETKYMIVRCLGCDGVSFRHEFHDYESLYQVAEDEWEHDQSVDIYPRVIEGHKEAAEIYALPAVVRKIYQESLSAFKNDLYILTGIGFRATVEAICKERAVTGKDLAVKINNLAKIGLLSKTDADLLHSIRFIGNDAAHEIAAESKDKLAVALRIIDHLLHSVYIIANIAGTLERIVDNYDDFKALVKQKAAETSGAGPRGLTAILGRSKRRILSDLTVFEDKLVEDINSGAVNWLVLGPVQSVNTSGKPVSVQTFDSPQAVAAVPTTVGLPHNPLRELFAGVIQAPPASS